MSTNTKFIVNLIGVLKIRKILFFIIIMISYETHSGMAMGYGVGMATGMATANILSNNSDENIATRNYDYIIACKASYLNESGQNYRYFCTNPPTKDIILFMSTIFDNDHWPTRIIYYMKRK